MRKRVLALAVTAVLALAVVASAMSSSSVTTLNGTVGPGFTITLKQAGKKVTSLKAGKYKLVVADKSPMHNFVLEQSSGGKWEKDVTTVSATGTKTLTVTLKKGKWEYYCAPHESTMHGDFKVT